MPIGMMEERNWSLETGLNNDGDRLPCRYDTPESIGGGAYQIVTCVHLY